MTKSREAINEAMLLLDRAEDMLIENPDDQRALPLLEAAEKNAHMAVEALKEELGL